MLETVGVRYPRAPIAEAVLDVRVEELEPASLSRIGTFADVSYPTREESVLSSAEIETGPLGVATRSVQKMNGFRLTSEGDTQIVQMRSDGFTFSRLSPYEDWKAFYTEARRLWLAYVDLAEQLTLNRAALRYINQIQVPAGDVKIDDYLRTRPEISPDMPSSTSGFFMSLDIPLPDFDATARIVETVLDDDGRDKGPRLVLDVDVYRPMERMQFTSESEMNELDAMFGELRNAKNLVFEASITDKSRGLFR